MKSEIPVYAALDIGHSEVTAIIAEMIDGENVKVVGVGRAPSYGLKNGVIVDLERTTEAIRRAVSEAEGMAGGEMPPLHVNIGGGHIRSVNSRGVVAVSRRGGPIEPEDVERVLQAARAIPVPPDREVLHVLPQEFIVDDQGGIKDPVGMMGARLEVAVHIVTGSALSVGNIHTCVQQAGYTIESLTLTSLAAAEATITEREREMGIAIVDVGSGITGVAVYADNAVRHTGTVPVGGRHVTNDLAIGLRTPVDAAEVIKTEACVDGMCVNVDWEAVVSVPGVGDQPERAVTRRVIGAIIAPRLEEIFQLASREIQKAPTTELLASGIVLTGGGACIPGACELAERVFNLPVRLGRPQNLLGLSDMMSSPADVGVIGLVRHAARTWRPSVATRSGVRRLTGKLSNVLSQLI
ncbi:MAG TPA: cell division protein FtsA [bacterium]|nr:cell division protein FtsA [bacterium]